MDENLFIEENASRAEALSFRRKELLELKFPDGNVIGGAPARRLHSAEADEIAEFHMAGEDTAQQKAQKETISLIRSWTTSKGKSTSKAIWATLQNVFAKKGISAAGSEVAFVMEPHGVATDGGKISNQIHWILDSGASEHMVDRWMTH